MTNINILQYNVREYCSDAVELLPHGIIHKSHTGMGATHLELHAKRNSIIIEPVRITAKAKADSIVGHEEIGTIYIGGELNNDIPSFHIPEFELFLNVDYKYKKIVCVADSFPKAYEVLMRRGVVNDYFLLIDEIDSFQMDSSFRYSMEKCMDIYLTFPETQRAMLTATPINFSDARLENEQKVEFNLIDAPLKPIKVEFNNNSEGAVIEHITRLLSNSNTKNDQIVVALNSLISINKIIQHLLKFVNNKKFSKEDISILCGVNSKQKAGEFYRTLTGRAYPTKLTFITSAYFTGYDIEQPYHLICSATDTIKHSLISVDQIKQISGRLRSKELLSNRVILDVYKHENPKSKFTYGEFKKVSLANMKETANKLILSFQCMQRNFQEESTGFDVYELFMNGAIQKLEENNKSVIRKPYNSKEYTISNFYIDSQLAQTDNYFRLYTNNNKNKIIRYFKQKGFDAEFIVSEESPMKLDRYVDTVKEKQESDLLTKWLKLTKLKDSRLLLSELESNTNTVQLAELDQIRTIYSQVKEYCTASQYFELVFKYLVQENKLDPSMQTFKNQKAFFLFRIRLFAVFVNKKDDGLYILLKERFKEGEILSKEEIMKRLKKCIRYSPLQYVNNYITKPSKAMAIFNIFFNSTLTKKKGIDERLIIVKGLKKY
jgi:hypothetical protein